MLPCSRFVAHLLLIAAVFAYCVCEAQAQATGEGLIAEPSQFPTPPGNPPASTALPSFMDSSSVKTIDPQTRTGDSVESSANLASPSSAQSRPSDPLAPVNRKVLTVNEKLDHSAVHPMAAGWANVVPNPARHCIDRFFDNTKFIPRFANALFQLKLKDAGGELARFGINTTLGVGGLFDPAEQWFGIHEHDNDFGTTLRAWGMPEGWFVMMPVGGPINVRETVGHFVDGAMNPMNYLVPASGEVYETIAHSVEGLNKRADDLNKFEGVQLKSDKPGPTGADSGLYETVRTNYIQQQEKPKTTDDAVGIAAATAGAGTAATLAVGSPQGQAAAIGTASQGTTYLGK
jgi:phospholipid-binding lipoprotein MlaA